MKKNVCGVKLKKGKKKSVTKKFADTHVGVHHKPSKRTLARHVEVNGNKEKSMEINVYNKSSNCLICKEKLKSFRHLLIHITTKHFKSAVNKLITLKYPGFWVSER